ncbi:S1C family serine protease [Aureibacillus halotolerans]|uniref:Serine protease Do n=1 Tax=Aureibacillus halotolerans TaxID=1508390 RepID=A0A4R6TSW5_9BACI|nr:S1C family serine protease [Aureibacillus halotolerans]TDQ36748.1 serine protease Do [Aureibacillus halotolerans]
MNNDNRNSFDNDRNDDFISGENEQQNDAQYHNNTTRYEKPEITPYTKAEKPSSSVKKRKHWLSPVIGGLVGGALVFGASTAGYIPDYDTLASTANQNTVQAADSNVTASTIANSSVDQNSTTADIAEAVMPTIVGVVNYQQQPTQSAWSQAEQEVQAGTGSGVIFKKDNGSAYIVTNNHVVEGASQVKITLHDGEEREAEIVGTDPLTDLAVLKIDDKGIDKVSEFGQSSELRAGEKVIAIGNPLGLEFSGTVTEGIVSGLNRTITVDTSAGPWQLNVLQTDAAINPGNSGGPLLNTSGQVIGINSLKIKQAGVEGLGFAIPSEDVLPIVNELMENGEIQRPTLGVKILDVSQIPQNFQKNTLGLFGDTLNNGVYVDSVQPGSTAEKAGLQSQDVIVAINDKAIEGSFDLRRALYTVDAGEVLKLKLIRNGDTVTVDVHLSDQDMAQPEL